VQRRSSPYPSATSFDAPDRSSCTVKRPRTSTPLQALVLQNDPVYIAAAKALADRLLQEAADRDSDHLLIHAFRTVLSRTPDDGELVQLRAIFDQARDRYDNDKDAANRLVGDRELRESVDTVNWAAWFNVAHVLLNLDETITKN
jgi:hypothetical protein